MRDNKGRFTKRTPEKISGYAFHCHHDQLVEFVTDYQERVDYINKVKPPEERKLRLELFKMISSNLLPFDCDEAGKACDEARKVYDEAWKACDEAWKACDEAGKACDEARKVYDDYFIELHEELCPHCPWDGKTIFS